MSDHQDGIRNLHQRWEENNQIEKEGSRHRTRGQFETSDRKSSFYTNNNACRSVNNTNRIEIEVDRTSNNTEQRTYDIKTQLKNTYKRSRHRNKGQFATSDRRHNICINKNALRSVNKKSRTEIIVDRTSHDRSRHRNRRELTVKDQGRNIGASTEALRPANKCPRKEKGAETKRRRNAEIVEKQRRANAKALRHVNKSTIKEKGVETKRRREAETEETQRNANVEAHRPGNRCTRKEKGAETKRRSP